MNTPVRHNPLGNLDADDDDDQVPAPQPRKPKLPREEAERIARQQGFAQGPGKESPAALVPASVSTPRRGRRRVTGRTHQINVKTTEAAIEQFYKLAEEMRAPLGEVLEQALDALEKARK